MASGGCPPFVNVDYPGYPNCRSVNSRYFEEISRLKPDIVVLSAYWPIRIKPLADTIRSLKKAGALRMVVLGPVPIWKSGLPRLLVESALRDRNRIPESWGPTSYSIGPSRPEGAGENGWRFLCFRN